LFGLLEAQLTEENFIADFFRSSDSGEIQESKESRESHHASTAGMVGTSPKDLESACELIRFEHTYSKIVPEIGAEADIETSEQEVDDRSQTPCNSEVSDETCNSGLDSDDLAALAVLDLVDLATEFDQISQMSVLSYLDQNLSVDNFRNETEACESIPTYVKCDSPYMQLNEDNAVCIDSETCVAWSPSCGYNSSSSPCAKSPLVNDFSESFFNTADAVDCDYSWQDSFCLFPSLTSYD